MWGAGSGRELEPLMKARTTCLNEIRRAVAERTGSIWLDVEQTLCTSDGCPRALDGMILRPDEVHFDGASARWLARWMLAEVGLEAAPE
jgi:hypothetical protein